VTVVEATASVTKSKQAPRVRELDAKGNPIEGHYVRPTKDGTLIRSVGYTDSSGQWVIKTLGAVTLTEAKKERRRLLGQVDQKQDVSPSRVTFDELAALTFNAFEALVISGERKRRTLTDYQWRYKRYLKERLGRLPAQKIERQHILDVLDDLRRDGKSTSTLHAVYRTFAVIVGEGRERKIMNCDIRLGRRRIVVKNKRSVFKPSADEARRIALAAAPRWRTMFLTAATIGARASELLGLTVGDLNLTECDASISITKQLGRDGSLTAPKTVNGTRVVRIGNSLRLALLEHYNGLQDKSPEAFLFAQDTELVGRYGLARRAFTAAVNRAGIAFDRETQRLSQHCLRHAAAKRMLRDGRSVDQVAAVLGDTVQTVVNDYLRIEEHDRLAEQDPTVLDFEVAA